MLKKFLLLLVVSFSVLVLVGCGPKERTYKADGVYTAFTKEKTSGGGPQVTFVSVTIKKDKIESFYIDCVQSFSLKNTEQVVTGWSFNEKSKKDLGYLYGMHNNNNTEVGYTKQDLTTTAGLNAYKAYLESTGKKEWFEQAALIEDHFKNVAVSLTVDADKYITNVAGVTIKDGGYSSLAASAVQNAKDGVTYVLTTSADDIYWVKAEVDAKGKFTSLELNTLQGQFSDGTFSWRDKNKQELGYEYGMHNKDDNSVSYTRQTLTTAEGLNAYKAYLTQTGKKEWFEQANIITDYVLANGLTGYTIITEGTTKGKLNQDQTNDALSGVTVTVDHYFHVIEELYNNFK